MDNEPLDMKKLLTTILSCCGPSSDSDGLSTNNPLTAPQEFVLYETALKIG